MQQLRTLIVGASMSGLACAASLHRQGIDYMIIEKQAQIAAPSRQHYDRLHLHSNKRVSNLPFKKFGRNIPRYPSRQQVIEYLEEYRQAFHINPIFNTEARSIRKEGNHWITETTNGAFQSRYLIMATGPLSRPKAFSFAGMESFPSPIMHSAEYQTGADFKGQKVLVVGFGNSACEIALDLHEQGALPAMAVRSPVNVIPRDLLGIPILEISQLMSRLPPRVADTVNAPLMRVLFGDISKLGLKKMPYGTFEEIKRDGNIPVVDIGTIRLIRHGHIKVYDNIRQIAGRTVHFVDGQQDDFDAIIAAVGFYSDCDRILQVDASRFEDLKVPASRQKLFGKDGLYFCGFHIGPRGLIREIRLDARKIAGDIAKKERLAVT